MRVTNRLIVDNSLQYIQDNIERLDQLRMHAGQTKRIQKTPDDPNSASASDSLNSSLSANQVYIESAQTTDEWMEINEIALREIEGLTMRALNFVKSCLSQDIDHTSLQALQTEFKPFLKQSIDAANSQYKGNYVFAGTNVHTQPFTLNVPPFSVTYNGDDHEIIRSLGPNENVTINIDGQAVYGGLFNSLIDGINATEKSDLENFANGLQNALEILRQARIINGARQRQVISAIDQGKETDFLLQALLQQNEDVCLVDALKDLQQEEITYQTALEVANRTLATMNLFVLM